jgi:hypothetical protein
MNLINDISPNITRQTYRTVIGDFLGHFRPNNRVVSIGQIGEISEPSISDIDCLVVVRDGQVNNAYRSFSTWRGRKEERSYLFFHPPLFIAESMESHVPYLHSLNALRWLYQETAFTNNPGTGYRYYLNLVWASYILSISMNMYFNRTAQSLRKALLILKNIHISLDFLQSRGDAHERYVARSETIRHNVKRNPTVPNTVIDEIKTEFLDSMRRLLHMVHHDSTIPGVSPNGDEQEGEMIPIKKKIDLHVSPRASITHRADNRIRVSINASVVDYLLKPWYSETHPNDHFRTYREHLLAMYRLCRNEKVPFHFVTPFDIPVYRGRRYLIFRESMLRSYRFFTTLGQGRGGT